MRERHIWSDPMIYTVTAITDIYILMKMGPCNIFHNNGLSSQHLSGGTVKD